MLDWFFGKSNSMVNNPRRTQLFFRDDYIFSFRKLLIFKGFFILGKKDKPKEAWAHKFNLQFNFNGFRRIPADAVSIGFDRDILFDPFNILKVDEKPKKGLNGPGPLNQKWISDIATSSVYELQQQKPKSLVMDKVTLGLTIVLVMIGLAFLLTRATTCM